LRRPFVITLLVLIVFSGIATVAYMGFKASIAEQYSMLRSGQASGRDIIAVDQATYKEWSSIISSKEWDAHRTTGDAFSLAFPKLPDAGFAPNINGYLNLWAAELPPPDTLSLFELIRWRNAAALRMVLVPPTPGKIYVYESGGVVQGFTLPDGAGGEMLHFGMLEDGKYAEYLAIRTAAEPTPSEIG